MTKLVATDMDGTFLTEAGTYDKERLAALLPKLANKGILFAVSSGRSLLSIDELFRDFLDQIAVIAENGSVVQYKKQLLFLSHLSKEQCQEISETIRRSPHYENTGMLFSGQKAAYVLKESSEAYLKKAYRYYNNVQVIDSLDAILDDVIFKVTTNFTGETVLAASEWLDQQLSYVSAVTTGFDSIDVILKDVHKGFGLSHLCQELGITADEVIAFGDNLNDYQMLTYAGKAIATENARPEIKAISDQVIGHCNEQSVLVYLEGMVK